MAEAAADPGVARAGAAFAARRKELRIQQRKLADQKIITASSLIAFEKGRSWPRERTRAVLEELVNWPAGTLAKIRAGAPIPGAEHRPRPNTRSKDAAEIAEAVTVAIGTIDVVISQLPNDTDPAFPGRVTAALADLRKLEQITARAVRGGETDSDIIKALSAVRRRYDELAHRVALLPQATLGQRLYVARRRANLSVGETAAALGAAPELVLAVEGEIADVDDETTSQIEKLIDELVG